MNTISKKMNTVILAAMVACSPVCASENQAMVNVAEQQDAITTQDCVVWYKKRSTHIVAALAATAVGIYALAIRKNKVAGPMALFAGWFYANKKEIESKDANEVKDADKQQDDNNESTDSVTSENQKTVTPEEEILATTKKEENNQPLPVTEKAVEDNTQSINEAPLYNAVQQSAQKVSNWFKNGFISFVETE